MSETHHVVIPADKLYWRQRTLNLYLYKPCAMCLILLFSRLLQCGSEHVLELFSLLRVVLERNHRTKQFVVTRYVLLVDAGTIQLAQQTIKYSQASWRIHSDLIQAMLKLLRPNPVMSLWSAHLSI